MTCTEGFGDRGLFAGLRAADAARLLGSPLGGLLPGEAVADVFCGAGGWGEGGKRHGVRVGYAVNHWDRAITTHAANNAGCAHHLGDAWRARPRDVIGKSTKLGLLLASAACTTHSKAAGGVPISKRVHMLGWCIARWMEEGEPRVVWVENVPEWKTWGPLIPRKHRNGKPVRDAQGRAVMMQDPARKGQHFRKWWRYCERLGYAMEARVLDAPDFGGASRRKRLFIQARNDGMPLVWPEKTHGTERRGSGDAGACQRNGAQGDRGSGGAQAKLALSPAASGGLDRGAQIRPHHRDGEPNPSVVHPYRSAAEIIDWSDLGTSIFERPRPLKPKTLARIAEGIRRFVLKDASPFVLSVTQTGEGGGWKVWPVDQPLPTQTTRQDVAVCTPVVAVCAHGDGKDGTKRWGRPALPIDGPINCIHAGGNNFGLVSPILTPAGGPRCGPSRADDPLGTVLTRDHRALVSAMMVTTGYGERAGQRPRTQSIRDPLNSVVAQNVKQAVVSPVMLNFRGTSAAAVRRSASHVGEPAHAITTEGTHHALVAALMCTYYGSSTTLRPAGEPLGCLTTLDRHALVSVVIDGTEWVIIDILFRMLRPRELAAAMGFPADYRWPASQRDATRLIGNAVHVEVAAALIGASLPRMRAGMNEGVGEGRSAA